MKKKLNKQDLKDAEEEEKLRILKKEKKYLDFFI